MKNRSTWLKYGLYAVILGRRLPVPGGIGIDEAGMVGMPAAAAATMASTIAASCRVSTILWQAVLGSRIYFLAWRRAAEKTAVAEQPLPVDGAAAYWREVS